MARRDIFSSLVLTAVLAATGSAQIAEPRIGHLEFPVTAGPEAHREFITGVLWMHSFEYPRAEAAFQRARTLEPGFVMAYWGEAMTHTHPIWNQQDVDAARAVLAALAPTRDERLAKAPTPRERRYLEAVEILYGEGSKPKRDTLYAEAMERLVRAYPDDLEAKAFYALALLGLSQGVRDTATYNRAAAWADTVFRANPRHPGAAHYLIHAWDDPYHARLGLEAARAYAEIAPDAAHAQHMTTHIFLALGMWDEVISQNTLAMDLTARLPGHYTSWLHYGLLQQGRFAEATAFLEELRENMATRRMPREASLAWMRAAHAIATGEWETGPALWTISLPESALGARAHDAYFRGEVAWRWRDADSLRAMERELARLREMIPGRSPLGAEDPLAGAIQVMELELRALRHLLDGDRESAIGVLRRAAALETELPLEYGPPQIVQPSLELLGIVLAASDPEGALRAFQRQLELTPGRARSLVGLASAAAQIGRHDIARNAVQELARHATRADPEWKAMIELLRDRIPTENPE
jgi:tetratricopeptide (TPR) repeat protein